MSTQLSFLTPPEVLQGLDRVSRTPYHVRVPLPGPASEAAAEIKRGERKARQQDEAILAFFRANLGRWSPSQVWLRVGPKNDAWSIERDAEGMPERVAIMPRAGSPRWPITSIRRSITGLTDAGFLRITMHRAMGMFGRLEHLWELSEKREDL